MTTLDPTLCACGSGLRALRCCERGSEPLAIAPGRVLRPKVERAARALQEGDTAAAEALCRDILEQDPNQPGALATLYRLRKAEGALGAAEVLLRRLVAVDPNNLWATREIVQVLNKKGNASEAEIHARNLVRLAPTDIRSHSLMGMVMAQANRAQAGEYHYRKALELSRQRDPVMLSNLAWTLKGQGKMEEARRLYVESAALDPNQLTMLTGWARMEEADRNFERARELLDQAERLAPGDEDVLLFRVIVQEREKAYEDALATLEKIRTHRQDGQLRAAELAQKGQLLDKMERFGEAFAVFEESKARLREVTGNSYQAENAKQLVKRLMSFFTREHLAILPRAEVLASGAQPIFILGFPRSGTTMVEQILSAHPRIAAGDELPIVNDLTQLAPRLLGSPLPYPEALSDLWLGDQVGALDDFRDYYLRRAHKLCVIGKNTRWFTDKMPLNETHLGFIGLIFPRAPIIHVLRHPLDVVLSVFANQLDHGFFCAYALESAAQHFVLIADLVEHYIRAMPLRYLPLRYEDLVTHQEPSVRKLLTFLGEPFDKRCLSFHENRRHARTASYAQVTEKLYDSSRYRYRHYLKQLAPVIPILEPVILRLGYSI